MSLHEIFSVSIIWGLEFKYIEDVFNFSFPMYWKIILHFELAINCI